MSRTARKKSFENETKEALSEKGITKEKVIVFREDISFKDFNPKSVSSPKVKESGFVLKVKEDEGKEDKIKEHFFACSQCNYISKKEGSFKKHMLTKHKDLMCKECKEMFQSPM